MKRKHVRKTKITNIVADLGPNSPNMLGLLKENRKKRKKRKINDKHK